LLALRKGDTVVVDASEAAVKSGQTNPAVLQDWLKSGVAIYSQPQLHAKVFVFGSVLFVGSTNVSRNSQEILHEAVLRTNDRSAVADARHHVKELAESATRLRKAELGRLAGLYSPARRSGPLGAQPGDATPRKFRGNEKVLFIELWAPATAAEMRWVEANESAVRRRAGLKKALVFFSVDTTSDSEPSFGPGDLVVRRWPSSTKSQDGTVTPPAQIIAIHRVESRKRVSWVALCDERDSHRISSERFDSHAKTHRLQSIDWDDLNPRSGKAVGNLLRDLFGWLYE